MNPHLIKIFFFLIFLASSLANFASEKDYIFKQIKIEDGLSQSTVFCSIQDVRGFMWFGTIGGLNKYDGYKFTVYTHNPSDSNSISDDAVTALFQDSKGTLWIGTVEGYLNKYDWKLDSFKSLDIKKLIKSTPNFVDSYYEYPLSFSRNLMHTITSIIEDKEGFLWIGTWGKGVIRINKSSEITNHFYWNPVEKNSLPTNRIMKLLLDSSNDIWIGTFGGGLCKAIKSETGNFALQNYSENPQDSNSLSDNKVISLFEDSNQNIWAGTYGGGLNFLSRNQKNKSPNEAKFVRFEHSKNNSNSISNNTVMAICEDNLGYIWAGTLGGGLSQFNPKTKKFLTFKHNPKNYNSLADNDVLSLSVERSGIIWAGSHLGEGITKIQKNRTKFNLLRGSPDEPNGLSDNVVWTIYEDRKENLWVGTYRGGITKIENNKTKFSSFRNVLDNKNSLSSNHIRVIREDKYGNLWIGTYNAGLNILKKSTGQIRRIWAENKPGKLNSNQIQSILFDSNSECWVGTFGGGLLNVKYKGDPFFSDISFNYFLPVEGDDSSISDNRVYKVFEDKKSNLWIGTYGGGINLFDKLTKKFKQFKHDPENNNSLSDDNILCISDDSDGSIWIGTYGGGLNNLNPESGEFKRYSQSEGLLSGAVYGILEDDKNNIWLSTDNGVFKFNTKEEIFIRYDIHDGLQSLEFSGGGYFKSSKGEFYFGGINGLNYFFPDSIKENSYSPQIAITSIFIKNNLVLLNPENLELKHSDNFLTFEFTSLDFSDPVNNQYSYMLEGFDNEWQFTNAQRRMANYTNVPPGEYKFIVRGTNSDGIWSENEASILINIIPPFWQNFWFILLVILMAAGAIYYISTLRIKNLLAIEKLKTKLAADLHDSIGSGLTEISILSEVTSYKCNDISTESQSELKKISGLSRELVDNMADIVWVVNPKRDTLHDLVVKIRNSYNEVLHSLGIQFRVNNLEQLKGVKLPLEFKQNIYLILKEGISNSIKHSKCTEIKLNIHLQGDVIEVLLSDNGVGFNHNEKLSGNGIRNIQRRVNELGGKINWITSPGTGTTMHMFTKISSIKKIISFFKI